MKRLILLTLLMVTMICPSIYGKSKNDILVGVNDQLVEFTDMKGQYINQTTYVPLREFAQALGVAIEWNEQDRTIELNKGFKRAYLDPTSKVITAKHKQDVPCELINKKGTLLIPARTLAEYFEYSVKYLPKEKVLRIVDTKVTLTDAEFYDKYMEDIEKNKAKVIYLTFDDGPNQYTAEILKMLAEANMKATFFMLDEKMKANPEIVQQIIDQGHTVALHGVSHEKDIFYNGTYTPLNEMNTANDTLEKITGKRSALVRMPYGSVPYLTTAQYNLLVEYGYRVWDWHVDSRDWANKNPSKTYQTVIEEIKMYEKQISEDDPLVVLFHDRKGSLPALKMVIEWMNENDYTSDCITKTMKPKTFKKINK